MFQESDVNNYNQPIMRYAATKIMDKPSCKKHYEMFANMSGIIDHFMLCALTQGEINEKGDLVLIDPETPKVDGCINEQLLKGPAIEDGVLMTRNGSVIDEVSLLSS